MKISLLKLNSKYCIIKKMSCLSNETEKEKENLSHTPIRCVSTGSFTYSIFFILFIFWDICIYDMNYPYALHPWISQLWPPWTFIAMHQSHDSHVFSFLIEIFPPGLLLFCKAQQVLKQCRVCVWRGGRKDGVKMTNWRWNDANGYMVFCNNLDGNVDLKTVRCSEVVTSLRIQESADCW